MPKTKKVIISSTQTGLLHFFELPNSATQTLTFTGVINHVLSNNSELLLDSPNTVQESAIVEVHEQDMTMEVVQGLFSFCDYFNLEI